MSKRMEDLFTKLQSGQLKTSSSQKLLQLAQALDAQDGASASRLQQELLAVDWEANKFWLMGLKRLIPSR